MFTVYKITNNFDKRYYIGVHKTNNVNDSYLGSGIIISRLIKKLGKDNFIKEILFCFPTKEEAFNKEKELLKLKDKNCVNISEGGEGGSNFLGKKHKICSIEKMILNHRKFQSEECKKKIGEANKRRKISYNTRIKLSIAAKNRMIKPESRIKISNSLKNFYKENDKARINISKSRIFRKEKLGYLISQETRDKISKTLSGRKLSETHKNNIRNSILERNKKLKTNTLS